MSEHPKILRPSNPDLIDVPIRAGANSLALVVCVLATVVSGSLFMLGYLFIRVLS